MTGVHFLPSFSLRESIIRAPKALGPSTRRATEIKVIMKSALAVVGSVILLLAGTSAKHASSPQTSQASTQSCPPEIKSDISMTPDYGHMVVIANGGMQWVPSNISRWDKLDSLYEALVSCADSNITKSLDMTIRAHGCEISSDPWSFNFRPGDRFPSLRSLKMFGDYDWDDTERWNLELRQAGYERWGHWEFS